ncbi:hypothetical protein AA313_de0206588 [Arthrobotrys entomopaga]|nr:hypothetical protein AA313_de0206588 [Arthrobotrys entomopaga]
MTAASGMAPLATNTNISEDDERISLEKLVKLRDAVKAGQHPKYKPKPPVATVATTAAKASNANPNKNTNGNLANNNPIDTTARPIPVFTGSMPKVEQNGGRAVITVAGKDAPNQNSQNSTRNDRQQPQQQQQQGQRPLLSPRNQQQQQQQSQQQWDQNQAWSVPQMQPQVHANQEDINAFAQHLSMLPVPPPGFELPRGFPPFVPPPPLPMHGQALTPGQPLPQLMQMANQNPPQQLDPMAVDNPITDPHSFDHRDNDMIGNLQQRQAEIIQSLQSSAGTSDLQASLKKAQEYAATLPPKPVGAPKPNAPITGDNNNNNNNKQQQQQQQQLEKNRNAAGPSSSHQNAAQFSDRRDDDKQNYQRQQPRDHRQYHDKRSGEPQRKAAINKEREREPSRQFERDRDRDRWAGGVDNRNHNNNNNNKKRKSNSPNYDDLPSKAPNFAAPQPIRPADALIRSHDHHKVIDVDEVDDDQKQRANIAKDALKAQQSTEKKPSPAPPPVKKEALPPSPVVTIPRGSPTLEPLSPGRARAYGVPAPALPQERYPRQQGYFRYREQYPPPPSVGYTRSPYDPDYGYPQPPPPSHARDPRPISPRRVYVGPEGRGYAQEYVYQDSYHDPYHQYHSRRPGSPSVPPPRAAAPRYRYEEEDRVTRGRSPSPRVTNRMPATRPGRSSRSLSPGRERPLPRASAPPAEPAEEPRSERALIRASDASHYADYTPAYNHHRSMIPYDAYGDPYRPLVIRERVPVYITRVVYVDSNDPEGRLYRARSPGYNPHPGPPPPSTHAHHPPPPHSAAAPAHPAQPPPPPPPMRRYVDDPDVVMSDRMYRERDYDYGPYERGYAREYAREYPQPPPPPQHHHHAHHPPPPLSVARDAYGREYAMQPTTAREDERERHFREREREYPSPGLGGQPPPSAPPHSHAPPAARDVEDGRLPYVRDGRGMPPPPGGARYP